VGDGITLQDTLKPSLVARSAVPDSRRSRKVIPPPTGWARSCLKESRIF